MPNIIEQQDLLKNLPDARLATLLQNPVADIPPFLVAAEAQRRQSIRQQFAGSESKESVVDTLAKQIAKVPQNIQTPAQTPPMIPPTPQMQGVAALQQQQAVQNAVQQAQPQQQMMRHGGMVQRYYEGGNVKPWWQIPDISGAFSGAGSYIGSKVSELADWATTPYAERKAAEEKAADNFDVTLPDIAVGKSETPDATVSDVFTSAKKKTEPPPANTEAPPPPEPGETKDEYRARIEALYADRGVSDWEKAQKWFSMAEQFLDPSKTTMQSIAGAGQAFASSAGTTAQAERELELAREKALLEYDLTERDRIRNAEAERAQREFETRQKITERQTLTASGAMDFLGTQISALLKQMQSIDEDTLMTPEDKAAAKAVIQAQIDRYSAQSANLMKQSGYGAGGVLTMDELRRQAAGI